MFFEKCLYFINLIHCNGQIQIKTYQGFGIHVDSLPANHTKPNIIFFRSSIRFSSKLE